MKVVSIPDDGDGWGTIEILQDFTSLTRKYKSGEVLRVPKATAIAWIKEQRARYVGRQRPETSA